nr:hypothetical protein [Tanacetum cinerariifolium]
PDQERLINIVKNDISDDSSNDPLLEEADLFLASDNSIPSDVEYDFELDAGDEIECIDAKDEFDVSNDEDDGYYSFMFLINSKVFSFLLSAESEDTIFDPELMLSKRSRKNTKCVNAADEELTAAKHKLMLLVYCC